MKRYLLFAFLTIFSVFSFGQITTVGIIGTGTPGGWDTDTDMVQDAADTSLWTLNMDLTDGVVKFRANDDWAINWGAIEFPSGIGTQDGPDIPVFGGNYDITFNSGTGEYNFHVNSDIGIIGDATPGGWDEDTNMYQDQGDPNKFFVPITLTVGAAKFRKDDDWAVNWGASDFPMGIGTQDGPDIPIDKAGDYMVTLDTMSGEYNFEELITYETIGIIGDATPGGWDTDTDMDQDGNDPNKWTVLIELTDGSAKFRANDDWVFDWGGTGFPTDTAELKGPDIPVTAGMYFVTFNTETLIYNFEEVGIYQTVGLIGDATPGGWTDDIDMMRDEADSSLWHLRTILTDGEAKFRADDDWVVNWGAGDFPSGIAVRDGANIPVTAGEYIIDFHSITGVYNFKEIIVFDTIGIIGTGTEFANWDDDVFMTKDPADEFRFFINPVNLVDGEIKFRANADWAVNWGDPAWPSGVGTQDGPNILCVAGTWNASLRTDTGEYLFADPTSSVEEILDPSDIKVFPNPTQGELNIELSALEITGMVNVRVMDMSGRLAYNLYTNAMENISIDLSDLPNGNYFLQITNDDYLIGKRFNIAR